MNEQRPKVLVVDDEKALRTGVKRLLETENYEVTTAENGTEGIKLGTETEFDLAVIDLKMPDVDGIEVLRNIKKKFPNTTGFQHRTDLSMPKIRETLTIRLAAPRAATAITAIDFIQNIQGM